MGRLLPFVLCASWCWPGTVDVMSGSFLSRGGEEWGRPAAFARRLRTAAVLRGAAACFTVVALGGLWFLLRSDMSLLLLVVLPAGVAAALMVLRSARAAYGRLSAGITAERQVARVLRRMRPGLLAHGVVFDGAGGDADHVVVGPYLAVVETKYGNGPWVRSGNSVRVGRNRLRRDPCRQAAGQAAALRRTVGKTGNTRGVWVDAVVCVPGLTDRPFQDAGAWVCSARDLRGVLDSLPRRLTPAETRNMVEVLRRCQP